MGSYSAISERWWLLTFAGFILVLLLFLSHSRNGYNISVLQNLTVPITASTQYTMRDNMQSPITSDHIDNKEPEKSSDQNPKLTLQACMPSKFTYSEKPATSSSQVPFSGYPHSEPSHISDNVKPAMPSRVPSLDFENSRPSNFTAGKIEPVTSSSQYHLSGSKYPKPSKNFDDEKPNSTEKKMRRCNIFEGKWVYDPGESPLYDSAMCPFLSDRASCQRNGRPDKEYERWRWEANECKIPRFDARDMLERLRGKRVVLVGDSINFGQWESLACLLYSAIPDRSHVNARNRVFRAESYNLIIESRWAQFLVEVIVNKTSGKKILNLDSLSSTAWKWKGADVMVFNTGHWWMSRQRWDWFLYKKKLYTDMKLERAFKLAMQTWAGWIQKNVDTSKTTVFFRGLSPGHYGRNKCYRATQPIKDDQPFKLKHSESLIKGIVERTIRGMKTPVKFLNITKLTEYRKDAHSSIYWKKEQLRPGPDCSHWCLPGVPDTWNHLLYATMVSDSSSSSFA